MASDLGIQSQDESNIKLLKERELPFRQDFDVRAGDGRENHNANTSSQRPDVSKDNVSCLLERLLLIRKHRNILRKVDECC